MAVGEIAARPGKSAPGAPQRDPIGRRVPQLGSNNSVPVEAGVYAFRSRPDLRAPVITISANSDAAVPGLVFTDAHGPSAWQGPMVIDGKGDLVWFLPLSQPGGTALRAFNFKVQQLSGEPVLTWFQGAVVAGHGQGHYELWSSDYRRVALIYAQNGYQGDLHELVITPSGTAIFTCYGAAQADLTKFGGDPVGTYFYGVVQEVDVRTGKLLFEWRSDDHVPLSESYLPLTNPDYPWDYFHINAVQVDPIDGNLLISSRNTSAFYKVDRGTGAVVWQAGGRSSNFRIAPGAEFFFQHHVRRRDKGTVTLFNNDGGPPWRGTVSSGMALAFDEQARTIELAYRYVHSPSLLSGALGSVQDIEAGHRFVGWGESSYFTEYSSSGDVLFDGSLAAGTVSYRAFKQSWAGVPTSPPDLAVRPVEGSVTLYASYNGATGVSQWLVLGGPEPSELEVLGWSERHGFETAINLPQAPAFVAVEAVGQDQQVLGRSAAVPVPPGG